MKVLILLLMINCAQAETSIKQAFLDVGNEIQETYAPIAQRENLNLNIKWYPDDPIFNAFGMSTDNSWEIAIYGGLISKPDLTPEAFRFILCHEIGHIIGGSPRFDFDGRVVLDNSKSDSSSNSGQPDYYAASVCMKLLLKNKDNSKFNNSNIDPILKLKCENEFKTESEQSLCKRVGNAGFAAMSFLNANMDVSMSLSFATPSKKVAIQMESTHPDFQCRVDTILAGTLCNSSPKGINSNEADQMNLACSNRPSAYRPACWFVP